MRKHMEFLVPKYFQYDSLKFGLVKPHVLLPGCCLVFRAPVFFVKEVNGYSSFRSWHVFTKLHQHPGSYTVR